MARRTSSEIEDALTSVRTAIARAETSQEYRDALGQQKVMALLVTLYKRENDLLDERELLSSSSSSGDVVAVHGIYKR